MSTFNVVVVLLMCLRFYNSAMNSSLIVIGRLNSQIFSFRLRRILNFRFSSVLCVVPAAHDLEKQTTMHAWFGDTHRNSVCGGISTEWRMSCVHIFFHADL
jgi:hypothetical protein